MLVGVGVGVGLALARAERERRAAAARARPSRRTSLRPGEPSATGMRRVILEQLDLAIELLEHYPGETGERTVHEVRKALKRLRTLLRLLRPELGPKRYARETTALRDCARRLAGARDAEVMVGTLDALVQRHPELADPQSLATGHGVPALRAELVAERERAAAIRDPALRAAVICDLRAVHARVLAWELHERRRGAKLLGPGLERIYRQGRRRLRRARQREDPEAMHAWRKSVKDLRYAAETLDCKVAKADSGAESGSGRVQRAAHRQTRQPSHKQTRRRADAAKRMRRSARRADRIGEMLGEEHDLALLARAIRERPKHFTGDPRARKLMLKLIARRRKRLHRRALREGERLYRRKPKPFLRRIRDTL